MKKIILLFGIVLGTVAFGQSTTTLRAGRAVSVSFPSSYEKVFHLNLDAMLQMMNVENEKYTIIIQDEKEGFNYFGVKFENINEAIDFFTKNLIENLKDVKKSEVKIRRIGNYNAAEIIIEATDVAEDTNEEIKLAYVYTLIESPDFYYQVMSWTLVENKDKYLEEFRNIANSFKEL